MNSQTGDSKPVQATSTQTTKDSGWNSFWQTTGQGSALDAGGFELLQFKQIWSQLFNELFQKQANCNILDIACGNGLLTQLAHQCAQERKVPSLLSCLDISQQAILGIQNKLPEVNAVVGDAGKLPFADGQFDLAVSHFGIEYADANAFNEAYRVLSDSGEMMFCCHYEGGGIYQQCQRHLQLIEDFNQTQFVDYAEVAFNKGFALDRKEISISEFQQADKNLGPKVQLAGRLLRQHQQEPVAATLYAIFSDIGHMYRELSAYEPTEIVQWFAKTKSELAAYERRMRSMLKAALNEDSLRLRCQALGITDLDSVKIEPIVSSQDQQNIAWRITVKK